VTALGVRQGLTRRFQVDDELELGRLLDRHLGGLGALEDLIHKTGL
jgi:hypothetical protein